MEFRRVLFRSRRGSIQSSVTTKSPTDKKQLLSLLAGGLGFLNSRSLENARQRVVRLVARVLVRFFVAQHPRILAAPRPIPRGRVFHGEAVEQGVAVQPADRKSVV